MAIAAVAAGAVVAVARAPCLPSPAPPNLKTFRPRPKSPASRHPRRKPPTTRSITKVTPPAISASRTPKPPPISPRMRRNPWKSPSPIIRLLIIPPPNISMRPKSGHRVNRNAISPATAGLTVVRSVARNRPRSASGSSPLTFAQPKTQP